MLHARRGTRAGVRCAVAVALGLGTLVSINGCLQQACTDAGCTSGISVKVVGTFAVVPARARVCVDDACVTAPWPTGASGCEAVAAEWRLSVCLQDDGSLIQVVFPDDARVADRADFELVVEDDEGGALLHESERVRFSHSYPNGKRCPGRCKYANYRY